MGVVPERLTGALSERPTLSAVLVYAAVCVPAYFVFTADNLLGIPHASAGTTGISVVVGGLLMGSLMFVPALHLRFKRQYGGGQASRLGFVGSSNE
jgi:hypothetical protein